MRSLFVSAALTLVLAVPAPFCGQDAATVADFSITLKRGGCVGSCPDYEVTILGDGRVRYQGNAYVPVEGKRERTIPIPDVQKLAGRLQDEHFFQWEETDVVCVDYPEVHITATVGARRKRVLEGCNRPGKVLALAKEIDRTLGRNVG